MVVRSAIAINRFYVERERICYTSANTTQREQTLQRDSRSKAAGAASCFYKIEVQLQRWTTKSLPSTVPMHEDKYGYRFIVCSISGDVIALVIPCAQPS